MQTPIFTIGAIIIGAIAFAKIFPLLIDVKATPLAKISGALVGMYVGFKVGTLLDGIEIGSLLNTLILIIAALITVTLAVIGGRQDEEQNL